MKSWDAQAFACEDDCGREANSCSAKCLENDRDCVLNCRNRYEKCWNKCPCHYNCEKGCDEGDFCLSWDNYCPATTTQPATTTPDLGNCPTELCPWEGTHNHEASCLEMDCMWCGGTCFDAPDSILAINSNNKVRLVSKSYKF